MLLLSLPGWFPSYHNHNPILLGVWGSLWIGPIAGCWWATRTYCWAFGVTDKWFYDTLCTTFQKLDLPFQETIEPNGVFYTALRMVFQRLPLPFQKTLKRIRRLLLDRQTRKRFHLVSLDTDLLVILNDNIAFLEIKRQRHASTLKQIADEMTNAFMHEPFQGDRTPFAGIAFIGALLFIFVGIGVFRALMNV